MRRFIIYAWVCPDTGAFTYVGKTCRTVSWRMKSHYQDALRHPNQPKYLWLGDLDRRGVQVIAKELERCSADESSQCERRWIDQLRSSGSVLFNVAIGGGGGRGPENIRWTPDLIARLGIDFDTDIARDLGCSYQTVAYRRECLDIPPRKDRSAPKNKKIPCQELISKLGTKIDAALAKDFGVSPVYVFKLRVRAGIKCFGPNGRKDISVGIS